MTKFQNNANKFTNLNIVSFLDSDKMKQIEKVLKIGDSENLNRVPIIR